MPSQPFSTNGVLPSTSFVSVSKSCRTLCLIPMTLLLSLYKRSTNQNFSGHFFYSSISRIIVQQRGQKPETLQPTHTGGVSYEVLLPLNKRSMHACVYYNNFSRTTSSRCSAKLNIVSKVETEFHMTADFSARPWRRPRTYPVGTYEPQAVFHTLTGSRLVGSPQGLPPPKCGGTFYSVISPLGHGVEDAALTTAPGGSAIHAWTNSDEVLKPVAIPDYSLEQIRILPDYSFTPTEQVSGPPAVPTSTPVNACGSDLGTLLSPERPTRARWLTCDECWLENGMSSHSNVWPIWWPTKWGGASLLWLCTLPPHAAEAPE